MGGPEERRLSELLKCGVAWKLARNAYFRPSPDQLKRSVSGGRVREAAFSRTLQAILMHAGVGEAITDLGLNQQSKEVCSDLGGWEELGC